MEKEQWIDKKMLELKREGIGGLARIPIRQALILAWDAGAQKEKEYQEIAAEIRDSKLY